MADKYVVWKRNDGAIGASANYLPRNTVTGGAEPAKGESHRPGSGIPITFVQLGEFTEWWPAHDFIKEQREKQ